MTEDEILDTAEDIAKSLLAHGFAAAMTTLVYATITVLEQSDCLSQEGIDIFHRQLTEIIKEPN